MPKNTINYDEYVEDRFAKDDAFLKACLDSAFKSYEKDQEISYLLDTLKQAAKVRGFSNLARETGLSRQHLYEIFSKNGNPTIKVFNEILHVFGYKLSFKSF